MLSGELILRVLNKPETYLDNLNNANFLDARPGPVSEMPFVAIFLRDPSQYLFEFRRKPR